MPLSALAVGDQFRYATKMMPRIVTGCFAGLDGAMDGGEDVRPAGLAEGFLQVAGKPEFDAGIRCVRPGQGIEVTLHSVDEFRIHGC